MVFWSIIFFARGTRLGSLLLDQTGWPPVNQRATNPTQVGAMGKVLSKTPETKLLTEL